MRYLVTLLFAVLSFTIHAQDPTGDGLCTGLSYEVVSSDPLGTGATTFRLFANLTADANEVTAMYGTDAAPWEMIATDANGFYNHAVGSDFGGGVNPLFFAAFPDLEFDSWFTIGAEPGDDNGLNSAFDADLTSFDDFNSGGNFVVNTFIGGSVFVVPGANAQGVPVDGRVLLGQFTTSGQVNALVNVQIRDQAYVSHYAEGMTLTFPVSVPGCQDETACNFDLDATIGDGSCFYIGANECDCDGNQFDECGICGGDTSSCTGCSISVACNYDPNVLFDDGSCIFYCPGCTDDLACNYDSDAIQEDGSCLEYDDCGVCGGNGIVEGECDCDGNSIDECGMCGGGGVADGDCDCAGNVLDECGVCDGDNSSCGGCTDVSSCNYDPSPIIDDGSCEYYSCSGCMYEYACNYDPEATISDSLSCEFGSCPGCTDSTACNYNPTVSEEDGSCEYCSCNDCSDGCTNTEACNYDSNAISDDGSCLEYDDCAVCGGEGIAEGECDCAGNVLDECGVCGGNGIAQGDCDCDGNVLDECGICGGDGIADGNCDCAGNVLDECGVCGGSGIAEGDCDCEGNLLDILGECGGDCPSDFNSNGICDEDEILGCTYIDALNYNPEATADDGSCIDEELDLDEVYDSGFAEGVESVICPEISNCPSDLDGNGDVGMSDLLIFLSAFGDVCEVPLDFSPEVSITLSNNIEGSTTSITYAMSQDNNESEIFSSSVLSDGGVFNLDGLVVGDNIGSGTLHLELYAGNYDIASNLIVSNIYNSNYTIFNEVTSSTSPAYNVGDIAGGFVISNSVSGISLYTEIPTDEDYTTEAYSMSLTFTDLFTNPSSGNLTFTSTLSSELGDVDIQDFVFEIIAAPWICGDLVSHDGYDYSTVLIGDQCWFSENCRYLPEVSPSSEGSETEPYYYVYDYQGTDVTAAKSTDNYETYGVLYNWPAVMTEGICPSGWHIPSDEEFTELTDFLGGTGVAGGKMKEAGYDHWNSPNTGATNSSGFTGLPGGDRYSGGFDYNGSHGYWWSASESGSLSWVRRLYSIIGNVTRYDDFRDNGFSARCVRD
jgi:uncharacterized protein (TIGR02145 family)